MPLSPAVAPVRAARFPDDAGAVGHLLERYLRRTEREKRLHLGPGAPDVDAPLRPHHRAEVDAPAEAFAGAGVLLADRGGRPAGLVVVSRRSTGVELKRFWVEPEHRRTGVGGLLLDAAIDRAGGPVRLSVWDWRDDAIRAYTKRGFAPVASWDPRPRLVCMERPA